MKKTAKDREGKVLVKGDHVHSVCRNLEGVIARVRDNGVIDVRPKTAGVTYSSASFLWEKTG